MRTCTKCGETKPFTAFWPDRSKKQGYMARCKNCKGAERRAWRQRHPNHDRDRYQANRARERERHTLRKYGISLADYEAMFAAQGGRCAICRTPATRTLDIDHDHETGEVRGLLCTSCNRMLGHAGDDQATLIAAIAYLQRSSRKSRRSS